MAIMHPHLSKLVVNLAVILMFSISGLSQSLILTGRVINERNEPVSGATIIVDGRQGAVIANIEGRYTINLQAGRKYMLTVSSVGYSTKVISEVEVQPNIENVLNIVMEVAATTGTAVVVRSTRRQESTNALLVFQKNNTAVTSGLAADFIRRTPDKNTGEVLKRVSGASIQDNRFVVVRGLSDRYNAALINNAQLPSTEPDKKAFSFDVFPSTLIDNIIINKTATPDLPGEFAGGLVQVNTKDIPTRNQLSIGVSLGYNTNATFNDFYNNPRNGKDWLGFDNGTRGLPAGLPSPNVYNASSVQQQIDITKTFNGNVYAIEENTARPNQTYSLTWGANKKLNDKTTFGSIISLIYRNSMSIYNDYQRKLHLDDGSELIVLNDVQNRYNTNWGALANFTLVRGRHKFSFKNLFNQLFEDNFYTRTGVSFDRAQDIQFYSSVLNQRSLYSGQLEGEHQLTTSGIRLKWNGNAGYNWKVQPDLRTLAYYRPEGTTLPFEYNDDDTRRFDSELKDYSYGANGSISIPFKLGSEAQTLKAGGSTLIRIREFKSRIFRYVPADLSQFQHSKATLPYDQIFLDQNIGIDGFVLDDFTNNQDKYFGASALNGAYLMFDNVFSDKLRFVWGVRLENFQQFLTTKDASLKRIVVNTEKWDVLPSFNFTFSPNNRQNIRVSGSRTVSRPEFREIAPFSFFDYEVNYAINGNPNLQRGSILNADVRYELYPRGGEAFSIGAFYKKFDDPIEFILNPSSVVDRRNYEYDNADKAYSIGAELELRKGLGGVSQGLDGFNVFANLTYIYSKVTIPSLVGSGQSETADRPLQGQSPYLVNLGLQYNSEDQSWAGSVLYNRIGQRLALVGRPDIGFADVYERPRDQVDLQIARKILDNKGEIKLTWGDILNNDYYFYENIDSKKAYKGSTDRLFHKYNSGSTITLGFTYDFDLGRN